VNILVRVVRGFPVRIVAVTESRVLLPILLAASHLLGSASGLTLL
jgi:hypothetical protein